MKIKKMTATFGVLDHAVLTPGEGLTVIIAPNEAGKSTWAGFLKAMFYGIDTRERDKAGHLADKNRYQPWSGAPMEGELQLEWECQDITLRRFAAKGSPFSGVEAVYTASGDPVPGLTSANVGAAILGVGREVYLRSAFVGQGKAAVTPNGELEARIAALATSGQEDVSYSTVERTLKDWRNRRRANRSNGLLPELEEELAQAEQALQDMGRIRAQAQADQERLASLEAEQQRLKDDVALWDRIEKHDLNRRYGQALADQEAAQAALDALSPPAPEMDGWTAQEAREWAQQEQEQYQAAVDERRKLQEQRDAIQAASQKKARIAVILAAVLAAAGIVLGVLGGLGLATQLPPEVCFYTLLAAFAALIWRNRTLMDAQRKLDGLELPDPPQSQDWSGQAQAHADYLARQERLELELRHASQRVDDLAAQGGRAFDTLEYLTPPARSRVDTAARLARVEAEIAQRRQVLAQSQGRLEQLGNSEEAQARASQLEGHRLVRLGEYDALELAMKVLSDANDELRQRFSPALNQEAARILSALTGGRYQHLTLSRDFSAQAGPGNALPRSALYLSAGTLDQLYLALRLAICQLTLPGIPLVLDDALANFDDQRLDLALTFLEQLGQQRQVLLFSCQHREESWACAHQIPALTLGGGSQH